MIIHSKVLCDVIDTAQPKGYAKIKRHFHLEIRLEFIVVN